MLMAKHGTCEQSCGDTGPGDKVGTQLPAGPLTLCHSVGCHLLSLSILCWIIKHCRFNFWAGRVFLAAAWCTVEPMGILVHQLLLSRSPPQPLPSRRVAWLAAVAFPSFLNAIAQSPARRGVGKTLAPNFNQHSAVSKRGRRDGPTGPCLQQPGSPCDFQSDFLTSSSARSWGR